FGVLNVNVAGPWIFQTISDDGSVVYIDGILRVDNNGFHGIQSVSATVNLAVGQHSIVIGYMQTGGGQEMDFLIQQPGQAAPVFYNTVAQQGLIQCDPQATGQIHGDKFADTCWDGKQQTGEPGLAGVTIYLYRDNSGTLTANDLVTTTQSDNPATTGIDETGNF